MIVVDEFAGQTVTVLGLGRSGLTAARALAAGRADVRGWDDDDSARAAARNAGIPTCDPAHLNWPDMAALVASPGVPLQRPHVHTLVARARDAGVPIVGDIELFARSGQVAAMVGITGTNGKSTTTALLGHILKEAGRSVTMGANLGDPVLDFQPLGADGVYVLELSSFQLELTESLRCDVAVLLNLSPDHLDRHGSMSGYVAAKRRVFAQCQPPQTAIVGIDDELSRAVLEDLRARGDAAVAPISGERACDGVFVLERTLYERTGGASFEAALSTASHLPGFHNMQNAAAAFAAARALGVAPAVAADGLRSFPGLVHRLQDLGRVGGVRFINDSKATNGAATAQALACFDDIYWIAGGRAKEGGIDALTPHFGRIRHAFLIGEAAGALAGTLAGQVPHTVAGDLRCAVVAAFEKAQAEAVTTAVVLLSPACASFDQWPDFEARGKAFQAYVAELAEPATEASA